MNDREKLIELLGDDVCKHDSCDDCDCQGSTDMCIATLKVAMADHLIANGVTVQKWIPVTERLPEDGEICLVYSTYEQIDIRQFDSVEMMWVGENLYNDFRMSHVTHWMHLPESPKEVEK